MKDVLLYDTTLRDGCQAEDVSFTLEDKLRMAAKLDDMGIDYIEGGYPGSNPRDADFFKQTGDEAVCLANHRQQQMLAVHFLMRKTLRDALCLLQRLLRLYGKPVQLHTIQYS